MDNFQVPQPERESFVKHKRDVIWQILLPVAVVTLLGIAAATLAGFAATERSPGVSLWADISIIWLVIPMMLLALIVMAVMIASVYGLSRLLKVTPHYTSIAQAYAQSLSAKVIMWTDKLIKPVLYIKSWLDLITKKEE